MLHQLLCSKLCIRYVRIYHIACHAHIQGLTQGVFQTSPRLLPDTSQTSPGPISALSRTLSDLAVLAQTLTGSLSVSVSCYDSYV